MRLETERVAVKLGMRCEGVCRDEAWVDGEWKTEVYFAMLDHEWRPLGSGAGAPGSISPVDRDRIARECERRREGPIPPKPTPTVRPVWLATDRLVLRELEEEDAAALHAMASTPAAMERMWLSLDDVTSLDTAREYIREKILAAGEEPRRRYALALVDRTDDRVLGELSLEDGMIRRRHYEAGTDWEQLIAALIEAWTPSGPQSIWHIGDVSWWVRRAWDTVPFVWEDDTGQLVGFVDYDRQGEFELLVAPRHLGGAIHQQMLVEMEEELGRIAAADGTAGSLMTFAAEDNLASRRLLERSGYRQGHGRMRHMFRSLAEPIEEPALPAGFRVRHFAGQDEIEARIGVNNAVWTGSLVTPDRYGAVCGLSTYRQELDLVALAPDGRLVAFVIGWLDAQNRVGQLEPVGTDPDFRRRGLGRAVVLECLRRMQALGAKHGYVIPMGGSDATVRFYESCGFRIVRQDIRYHKEGTSSREAQQGEVLSGADE